MFRTRGISKHRAIALVGGAALILGCCCPGAVAQTTLGGLAGQWQFDEGAGTVASDSSGNGNTATLAGGAAWAAGRSGSALYLNGTSSYVNVPASSTLNGTGAITIAFWINPQNVPGLDERIVAKRGSWELKLNGDSLRPQLSSSGHYAVMNASLINGSWQHIAFTFVSGTIKGYLNGVPRAFLANTFVSGNTLPINTYGLIIGADSTPAYFAKGDLDDMRIYNQALGDADILAIYNGTATSTTTPTTPSGTTTTTGRTFYASVSGSDSVTCSQAQSLSTPKRTINNAVSCMIPGDVLYVRAGTYAENLDDTIPSGSSWTSPITVAAYQGEQVIVKPSGGQFVFQTTSASYIVLDGLIFDGTNIMYDVVEITYGAGSNYGHHIRVKNSEIRNGPRTGVGIHQGDSAHRTDYNEFINVSVHNNGKDDLNHGFYVEGSYNLIDNADVYNNSGWGLQAYTGVAGSPINYNTVRNSKFHDNAASGTRGVGIGLYNGVGNAAYNNVVYNNSGGITVNYGASGTKIYNNTVYNNNRGVNHYGIYNGNDSDLGRTGSIGAQIYNNIAYGNSTNLSNARSDASLANNLAGTDPKFVNASGGDFHLQAGSPAIDKGTSTAPTVTTDKDLVPRPKGAAYDIGAYEY